jgi:PAS domain S-box-containing protein
MNNQGHIPPDEQETPVEHIQQPDMSQPRTKPEQTIRELELQDSRIFLDSLIEQSPSPTWISDEKGTLIRINKACCDLLQITPEQVMEKYNIFEDNIIEAQGKMPLVISVFEVGKSVNFDLSYNTSQLESLTLGQSTSVRLNTTIFPIRNHAGNTTHAVIQHIDVTAQEQAEKSLRESEWLLRTLMDLVPHSIFAKDHQSQHLFVNRACATLNGLTPQQMIGLCDLDFIPDRRQAEAFIWDDQEVIESGLPKFVAAEYLTDAKGRLRTFQTAKVPFTTPDGESALLGVAIDITELKEAEAALRESEMRLNLAMEAAQIGKWDWDLVSGKIIWSENHERLWGYAPGTFPGNAEAFTERIHPEDLPQIWEIGVRARQTGDAFQYDHRVIWPDGSLHWVSSRGRYLFDENGQAIRLVGVVFEITARKQAEEALRASELKYRIVADNTYDWEFWLTPEGNFVYTSPSCERITGHKPEEFEADPDLMQQIIHSEDRARFQSHHHCGLEGGQEAEQEFRLVRPDGEVRWIGHICTAIRDKAGAFLGVRGSNRDITERKHAEKALEASNEQYRLLFFANPNPMFIFDEETLRFLAANDAAVSQYGWSNEEFLSLTVLDIRPPEDRQLSHDTIQRTMKAHESDIGVFRHHRKDGTVMHMDIRVSSILFSGRPCRLCSMTDVTDRKEAEEALRRSEEQVRLKLDSILSPDVEVKEEELVNLLDIPALQSLMDNFSELSHAVVAILDTSGKVLLSSGWQDICTQFHRINSETAQNCTESDLALAQSVRPGEHVAYHCRNGLWDVVTPLMIGGKHVGNIFTGQFFFEDETIDEESFAAQAARLGFDRESYLAALRRVPRVSREWVTSLMFFLVKFAELISKSSFSNLKLAKALVQQKLVEDDLRSSEELFRSLIEGAPEATFVQSEGVFKYVNRAMVRLVGAERAEDLLERPFIDHIALEFQEAIHQRMREQRETGKSVPPMEQEYLKLDGSKVLVETTAVAIRFLGQESHLVFVRDITNRKKTEAEQRNLQAQLQQAQKMESIGRLAGGVAHDYNNMLTVILGYTNLVLEKIDQKDQLHEDLLAIREAAERSKNLTRQLLAFARRQTIAPEILDLDATVENMLKMLHRMIGEDIDLTWRPGASSRRIMMDPSQINQILANLCVNARDAIPDVGKIIIETNHAFFDQVYCAEHVGFIPGEFVVLAVSDNGLGMEKEILDKIFEPFFTTKGVGKGTGLGLATVYGIVRQNEGFINVYSEPGKGTTFKIYLPQYKGPERGEQPSMVEEISRGKGEFILAVEDDPTTLKLLVKMLNTLNYRVLSADTPVKALQLAEKHSSEITMLITDVIMPEMNGAQLEQRMKTLFPNLKCLFMSGYTADLISPRGVLEHGVNFLQKPYSRTDLAVKIRAVLENT